MFPKGHKPGCNCCVCKAIRGEILGENNPNWIPLETRVCDCGCEKTFECKVTSKQRFIHGHNSSTMKGVYADLTGLHFGRLTVVRDLNKRNKHGHVLWEVICTCGKTKEISTCNLHCVQSCGCYRRGRFINDNPAKRPEVRRILSEGKLRENNPSWQGGISKLPYSFEFNVEFKTLIRERDNNTCQLCGRTKEQEGKNLCVHHIHYDVSNSDMDPERFITLCRGCNARVNFDRENWTGFFQKKLRLAEVMLT